MKIPVKSMKVVYVKPKEITEKEILEAWDARADLFNSLADKLESLGVDPIELSKVVDAVEYYERKRFSYILGGELVLTVN